MIDDTHAPGRRSWVASANGHADFPIQNLPFGVFSPPGGTPARRRRDRRRHLRSRRGVGAGLFDGQPRRGSAGRVGRDAQPAASRWRRARASPCAGASASSSMPTARTAPASRRCASGYCTAPLTACLRCSPATIGDYTDFFAGIHHATNAGSMFRPDNPLLPNYKYVPVAYHGRASSVASSAARRAAAERPAQAARPKRADLRAVPQSRLRAGARRLDRPGNELGEADPDRRGGEHIAGFCLLNDWSARDIQAWE